MTLDNSENYETIQLQESTTIAYDYSNYFENIQTMLILILACLVAIGCINTWVGTRRE